MEENNIDIESYIQSLKIDIDILKERKNDKIKIIEILESLEEYNKDIETSDEYQN